MFRVWHDGSAFRLLILLGCASIGFAQSLTLSSVRLFSDDGAAYAFVVLARRSQPSALQWTFTYPSATVASVSVSAGQALIAAGKSVRCTGDAAAYVCIASGMNSNVIANGVVASVAVKLSSIATTSTIAVTTPRLARGQCAHPYRVERRRAALRGVKPVNPWVSKLHPNYAGARRVATCTVRLIGAAPAATPVAISAPSSVTVPATVTVPSGFSIVSFPATAGPFTADQTASVTASLNAGSQTANLNLVAAATLVTSLQCADTSLAPNSNTSCTVTLSKAAPSGGIAVALSSSTNLLTAPATVTAAAGATSVTFAASTAVLSLGQTATLTASLNGSSQKTSLSLVAPAGVTSLQCASSMLLPGASVSCTVNLSMAAPAGRRRCD